MILVVLNPGNGPTPPPGAQVPQRGGLPRAGTADFVDANKQVPVDQLLSTGNRTPSTGCVVS